MSIWDLLRAKDANGLGTLLASGNVDVNQSGAGEQTPLHLASELDAKDCVMALLGAGAATEAEDGQLRTPLSLACESKSFESAQMLITGGASLAARDKNDMTPLHWVAQYGQAAGALALLRLAVAKGADIDAANYQMQSPLYLAIQRGNTQCALALVDAGASLAVEDETAGTMLHLTCQYAGSLGDAADSLVLLQRLLKPSGGKKVDVNSRDREKRTPLHWAAGKNALPCVTALLEAGADVNAADWAEHTPLQWAASTDAVESVEALLAAGAKVDALDRDKRTPLHWAADRAAERSLKFLLEQTKAVVDATDYGGFTALHYAARRGASGASIKLLLAKGANPNLAALSGETPADLAVDLEGKKALAPPAGSPAMKRKRSMSGGNINLESTLPTLVDAFYATVKKADLTAVRTLCVDALVDKVVKQANGVLSGTGVDVGTMHVSARTLSVHVDLTLKGKAAVHKLVFDDEGLIVASDVFVVQG